MALKDRLGRFRRGRSKPKEAAIFLHLHLVSDSTGETLTAVAKAALAQFKRAEAIEHVHALIRSDKLLDQVLEEIADAPGVVLSTMVDDRLGSRLEEYCRAMQIPFVPVLAPTMDTLEHYLGTGPSHRPGGQHALTRDYFDRIEALSYTMAHDDGQMAHDLEAADIVLVGVSRTSKTPTCIYLSNHRGLKVANVPIVPDIALPPQLDQLENPLVIGLTLNPDRLVQIRKNRLTHLNAGEEETDYVDIEQVRDEVRYARRLFSQRDWPVLDVTRRSIEETAAAVLTLYQDHSDKD